MKTVVKMLTLIFLFSSAVSYASPVDHPASIKTVSPKHQDVFSFKVDRKFKNGMIEVYYANGELAAVTTLVKRKMVINFRDVKSGTYIIKVKKNNRSEEFQFVKK